MSFLRGWGIYGLLLVLAAGVAIVTHTREPDLSPVPSVRNSGPFGLRALFVYLQERGYEVHQHHASLAQLPTPAPLTLVVAAPTAQPINQEEVSALQQFVESGGILIYLAPRPVGHAQPALDEWLGLVSAPAPRAGVLDGELSDPAGATVEVEPKLAPLFGFQRLRVASEQTVQVKADSALPVAEGALWWRPIQRGEVWIASGADLAENQRIELLDNLAFWERLASRGPITFSEFHHQPPAGAPLSIGVWALAGQFVLCAAFFVLARGARLGPPRSVPTETHRQSIEYVSSVAHLMRRARVEAELLQEMRHNLRILMHDRAGIPVSLADSDAARELERHTHIRAQSVLDLLTQAQRGPSSETKFYELAKEFARIERKLTGRAED